MAHDEDGAVEVLVRAARSQHSAHFLLDQRSEERSTVPQRTHQVRWPAAALVKAAAHKHCSTKCFGIDLDSEAGGEWTNFVVRLKDQLAPFAELSDAPGEDLGHQQPEEDAVLVVLDKFEGLEHGLAD